VTVQVNFLKDKRKLKINCASLWLAQLLSVVQKANDIRELLA